MLTDATVRTPRPHGKMHRWGFKENLTQEGAQFARIIDKRIGIQNHDIMCYDCGVTIPGPEYHALVEQLKAYLHESKEAILARQEKMLAIMALQYEKGTDEPRTKAKR